jgi:hypothetical protein
MSTNNITPSYNATESLLMSSRGGGVGDSEI